MSKIIGSQGEELAVAYLRKAHYQIRERNWRWSRAEIDIIAQQGDCLVIVEVKTRSSNYFGHPASFITRRQKRFLWEAANVYISETGWQDELRFDVIGILLRPKYEPVVEHFVDAFVM